MPFDCPIEFSNDPPANSPRTDRLTTIDRLIYGFLSICCFSIAVPALTRTMQLEVKLENAIQQNRVAGAIYADQIQGQLQSSQISRNAIQDYHIVSVSASKLDGQIQSSQISSLYTSQLQGTLSISLIPTIPLTKIDGTLNGQIQDSQIQSLAASKLVGSIQDSQIQSLSSSKLVGSIQDSQVQSLSSSKLVGSIQESQLQTLSSSKLVGFIQDSQIQSLSSSKLQGTLPTTLIPTISLTKINGTQNGLIHNTQISSLDTGKLVGAIDAAQLPAGILSNVSSLQARATALESNSQTTNSTLTSLSVAVSLRQTLTLQVKENTGSGFALPDEPDWTPVQYDGTKTIHSGSSCCAISVPSSSTFSSVFLSAAGSSTPLRFLLFAKLHMWTGTGAQPGTAFTRWFDVSNSLALGVAAVTYTNNNNINIETGGGPTFAFIEVPAGVTKEVRLEGYCDIRPGSFGQMFIRVGDNVPSLTGILVAQL